jgi:hypothetical protein
MVKTREVKMISVVFKGEKWFSSMSATSYKEMKNNFPCKFIMIYRDKQGEERETKEVKIGQTEIFEMFPEGYSSAIGWV